MQGASRLARSARVLPRVRVVPLAVAGILVLGLATLAPPPAARAADGVRTTAATTYELLPDRGTLRVTIDLTVVNRVPRGSRLVPCTTVGFDPTIGYYPIRTTCRQTIDHYVDTGFVWLERNARKVRLTANRGTVTRTVDRRVESFVGYKLSFAPVFSGETRTVRITYEVPGGRPRSATATRIGQAYTAFCVFTNGIDGGSVRVVVPAEFDMTVSPLPLRASPRGSRVVHDSGPIAETAGFYRCFEGTNADAFVRSELTSAGGRTVIVEGWPEDTAWRAAVGAEVGTAVDGLERLVGRPLPGNRSIRVREVSASELGAYAGTFDPETGFARIGEAYDEPGVVAHELSHAWFNLDTFATRWLSEGLAQWAQRVSPTSGPACTEPGPYPGRGAIDLDDWTLLGPRSTDAELRLVAYQYDASCWIVTALGTRMGDERMSAVIAALLQKRAAYGDTPTDQRSGIVVVDWRLFLDLVDELGLLPAGVTDLEYAQDLLLRYGVAETGPLAGRAEARGAYHALAADLGDWEMPDAIRAPLERWDFAEATARLATATELLERVREADATLAGIEALDGPVKSAFAEANDGRQLAAVRDLAAGQATAAEDVAEALEALAEPRDTIEEIGLLGVELQPVADRAVAAAGDADEDAASAAADEIRAALAGASAAGTQRVALAVGGSLLVLLLVGGTALVVRRRGRRVALVAAAAPAESPAGEAEANARLIAGPADSDLQRAADDGWGTPAAPADRRPRSAADGRTADERPGGTGVR